MRPDRAFDKGSIDHRLTINSRIGVLHGSTVELHGRAGKSGGDESGEWSE
jgi:hypothetical protein